MRYMVESLNHLSHIVTASALKVVDLMPAYAHPSTIPNMDDTGHENLILCPLISTLKSWGTRLALTREANRNKIGIV